MPLAFRPPSDGRNISSHPRHPPGWQPETLLPQNWVSCLRTLLGFPGDQIWKTIHLPLCLQEGGAKQNTPHGQKLHGRSQRLHASAEERDPGVTQRNPPPEPGRQITRSGEEGASHLGQEQLRCVTPPRGLYERPILQRGASEQLRSSGSICRAIPRTSRGPGGGGGATSEASQGEEDWGGAYLQALHGLRVLVGLDLAGHQQLGSGGGHLLGGRDELLLAGVALDRCVGCLTQVVGGGSDHPGLRETKEGGWVALVSGTLPEACWGTRCSGAFSRASNTGGGVSGLLMAKWGLLAWAKRPRSRHCQFKRSQGAAGQNTTAPPLVVSLFCSRAPDSVSL